MQPRPWSDREERASRYGTLGLQALYTGDEAAIDVGHVTFTVSEVNDAPVAVADALSSVAEDSGTRNITFAI